MMGLVMIKEGRGFQKLFQLPGAHDQTAQLDVSSQTSSMMLSTCVFSIISKLSSFVGRYSVSHFLRTLDK